MKESSNFSNVQCDVSVFLLETIQQNKVINAINSRRQQFQSEKSILTTFFNCLEKLKEKCEWMQAKRLQVFRRHNNKTNLFFCSSSSMDIWIESEMNLWIVEF